MATELTEHGLSEERLAWAEGHVREHGRGDFDRERDIHWGAHAREGALLRWDPEREGFKCAHPRCAGRIYYGSWQPSVAAVAALRRDPALQPLLAGLHTLEERNDMALAVARGELGPALRTQLLRRRATQTRRRRPEDEQRLVRCQRELRALVRAGASVEEAVGGLAGLHASDRERHQTLFGSDKPYAFETIRGYWKAIPGEERAQLTARTPERAARRRRARRKFTR